MERARGRAVVTRWWHLGWAFFACVKSLAFYVDEAFQQATFWAVLGVGSVILAEIRGR